jgi:antitoxin component YwqK of YwqJK toxin-antitoxin module
MVKRPEPVSEIAHYASGAIEYQGLLLAGEPHGAWEWFRTDRTLMRTGQFDRDRQVGIWRTFDRTGRLVKETDFNRG